MKTNRGGVIEEQHSVCYRVGGNILDSGVFEQVIFEFAREGGLSPDRLYLPALASSGCGEQSYAWLVHRGDRPPERHYITSRSPSESSSVASAVRSPKSSMACCETSLTFSAVRRPNFSLFCGRPRCF